MSYARGINVKINYETLLDEFNRKNNPKQPWIRLFLGLGIVFSILILGILIILIIDSNLMNVLFNQMNPYKGYIIGGLILVLIVLFGKTQDQVINLHNNFEQYQKSLDQYQKVSTPLLSTVACISYPTIDSYLVNGLILRKKIPVYFWIENSTIHFYEQPKVTLSNQEPLHLIIPYHQIAYYNTFKNSVNNINQTQIVLKNNLDDEIILLFDEYFYSDLFRLIPEMSQEMLSKRRTSTSSAIHHVKEKIRLSSQINELETLFKTGKISQVEYEKEKNALLEKAL